MFKVLSECLLVVAADNFFLYCGLRERKDTLFYLQNSKSYTFYLQMLTVRLVQWAVARRGPGGATANVPGATAGLG
jgi:hypothetical protein